MRRILEVNCKSNLSPNHALQLPTLRTSAKQKQIGCFNHGVVTLVADKLKRGYVLRSLLIA